MILIKVKVIYQLKLHKLTKPQNHKIQRKKQERHNRESINLFYRAVSHARYQEKYQMKDIYPQKKDIILCIILDQYKIIMKY